MLNVYVLFLRTPVLLVLNEGIGNFVSLRQVLTEPAIPSSITTNFQFVMPTTIGKGLLYS